MKPRREEHGRRYVRVPIRMMPRGAIQKDPLERADVPSVVTRMSQVLVEIHDTRAGRDLRWERIEPSVACTGPVAEVGTDGTRVAGAGTQD